MRLLTQIRARLAHPHGPASSWHGVEHRRPDRVRDGATRPCPGCSGVLEFRESYRIWRMERNTLEPAWVCQTHPCGYREFVRG